ncbi:hypothetical protein REPUB_Repub05bG0021700 [Reevesia pubescens]
MSGSGSGSGSGSIRVKQSRRSPVERQIFCSRLPAFDSDFLRDAISFMFSNFPDGWTVKKLWYVFAMHFRSLRRIADVYIPKRKDKRGGKFGFVRIKEVKNIKKLEEKLNSIWFGTYKLRATMATNKSRKFPYLEKVHNKACLDNPAEFTAIENPVPSLPRTLREISYKQALVGDVGMTKNKGDVIIDLAVNAEDLNQLFGCVVGELISPDILQDLRNDLWCNGFQFEISPLVGSLVFLKSNSKESLETFIKEEEEI